MRACRAASRATFSSATRVLDTRAWREREPAGGAVVDLDESVVERRFQTVESLAEPDLEDSGEHVEVESTTDHRGDREHGLRLRREQGHPPPDDILHRTRDRRW